MAAAAAFIGVTASGFRASIMPLLPPGAIRRTKPAHIHGPTVVAALRDRAVRAAERPVVPPTDGDPMMVGGTSPELERWRKIRASREQIKLDQDRLAVIPADDVIRGLETLSVVLRAAGESLRRLHGPAAQQIMNDCLEDFERNIGRLFPPRPADGQEVDR